MTEPERIAIADALSVAAQLGERGRIMRDDLAAAEAAVEAVDASWPWPASMTPEEAEAVADDLAAAQARRAALIARCDAIVAEVWRERARPGRIGEAQTMEAARETREPAKINEVVSTAASSVEQWRAGYVARIETGESE